ncbi:MAG: indolepyruvate ferredoxin oxidoreductase, partial [Desulfobacterales bacterium]
MDGKSQVELKEDFLLGNEAIARGAIESHIDFAAGYPGTPSSEIIETLARNADKYGIYVEWSTNEMVAFENALGASMAGLRAMVTMKHAGMNWVADPLSIAVLSGIRGGLVIVTADDPNCHSSANEQDSRFYGWFLKTLTLEPSDPQSAKDMVKEAFKLSEQAQLPVIVRSVTRVSHSRSNVKLDDISPKNREIGYQRDSGRFFVTGKRALQRCQWLQDQQPLLENISESLSFNTLRSKGSEKICIITSGVAATYVEDALNTLETDDIAVLKLGSVFPLPKSLVGEALYGKESVLVIEEGGPLVELQVKALASDLQMAVRISGKMSGAVPAVGELNLTGVTQTIAQTLGRNEPEGAGRQAILKKANEILPPRTMVFCAGCPHTGTMLALKKAMRKAKAKPFVGGDIGCYTLMCYPPHE